MNEANNDKHGRPYWENKIVESPDSIPFDKPGWFLRKEFDDFLEVLKGLRDYYAISDDVVIGLEPIGAINSVIKFLVQEICDPKLDAEMRDQAMWTLARLQAIIDDVATEAVMNQIDKNDSNN